METSAAAVAEAGQSTAARYESLIRIANSIRARKEPEELFSILAHELRQVIQFDGIASLRRDAYSLDEVRFCALVADQIALAMDDAINFRASQKAQERLELLLDLTNRAVTSLNLRVVLNEISAHIRKVMQCDGVGIDLPNREDGKLRIYAMDFPDGPSEIVEGHEPPAGEKTSAARAFH